MSRIVLAALFACLVVGTLDAQDVDEKAEEPVKISPVVRKGVTFLVRTQHRDGGWGAKWDINAQFKQPHERTITPLSDPGTTAFVAIALLKMGQTPAQGDLKVQMAAATKYILDNVDKSAADNYEFPSPYETQMQKKLGGLVDIPVVTEYLARLQEALPEDHELTPRVQEALAKCTGKLMLAHKAPADYKWNGWANGLMKVHILRSMEIAQASGAEVDDKVLQQLRSEVAENIDLATGRRKTVYPPGVELYDLAIAMWANSFRAREAAGLVEFEPKKRQKPQEQYDELVELLVDAGVEKPRAEKLSLSVFQNQWHIGRLGNRKMLAGFGSLGGEELVSYALIGEALAVAGGDEFDKWHETLYAQLARVQNADGSYYGHHCILSPVYNTAASISALSVAQDRDLLKKLARPANPDKP